MAIDNEARAAVLAVHAMLSRAASGGGGGPEPEPLIPGHDVPPQAEAALDPESLAEWEERAAILEFDGGFSRAEAECRATLEFDSEYNRAKRERRLYSN